MKKIFFTTIAAAAVAVSTSFAVEGTNSPYTDAVGDTFTGAGGGILDILGMEVNNSATDITFSLTVNANVATDWGKYLIGIGNTNSLGTTAANGNGWGRPISMVRPDGGGMNYWIGSWVDSGGGAENYSYNGASWTLTGSTGLANFGTFTIAPGASSTMSYTVSLASLGLSIGDTFYFDAYTSGGGGGDGAVDALANTNQSIADWGNPYVSRTIADGGGGLNSYQVVPEPSTYALLALSAAGLAGYVARRRSRK
jgi:hypothetical protein